MADSLKVMIAASEVLPFAKTGGLADVAGVLPKVLKKMGHDVRVVMPRYYGVGVEKWNLKLLPAPLGVPMGIIGEMWCGVYEGRLPDSDVPIYFIDHEGFYGRDSLYNEEDGSGFMDNDNRFVFLSRAALQLCKMLDFKADIVHANDWHTAAIPVMLNTLYKHDEHLGNAASILTIHNMQYQGEYYSGLMNVLDVGWEHFNFKELERFDQVNLLKGGITHATLFNTVSEGYAREMQTSEYGYGLEDTVRERNWALRGIINGCDYDEWNPSTDKFLAKNFDLGKMSGKKACKEELQKYFNLPINPDIPLFGVVSRLVDQKGTDVLAEAIYRILELDIQFVLLGSGDPWSHFFFGGIMNEYPQKFACKIGYDHALSHKIEAGCDFFVMPSRFEPCGLNQMYSLRYGTLPIVRATGGLDDTVENFNEYAQKGDGFKFYALDANSLFNTVGWATYTYYNNKKAISAMQKRAMEKRFTWEESARKYEEMYNEALKIKRG